MVEVPVFPANVANIMTNPRSTRPTWDLLVKLNETGFSTSYLSFCKLFTNILIGSINNSCKLIFF